MTKTAWGMTGITDTGGPGLLKLNFSRLLGTSWEAGQSGGVGKIGLEFSEYIGEEQ